MGQHLISEVQIFKIIHRGTKFAKIENPKDLCSSTFYTTFEIYFYGIVYYNGV